MGEVCDHGYPHFVVWAELTELQRREVVEGVYCPERDERDRSRAGVARCR